MLHTWAKLPSALREYFTRVHEQMCRAIDDEMAAQGVVPVSLPAGHRVSHANDGDMRHTYRFQVAAPRELGVGDLIGCRFPSPSTPSVAFLYSGKVTTASSRQLVITFRDDLGDEIAAGGIYVPQECACFFDVQQQLRRVVAGKLPFNLRVALQLLGQHEPPRPLASAQPPQLDLSSLTDSTTGLRLEQSQAVEDFCSRDLAVLWGPPGTGKTHVVSHGVVARARHGIAQMPKDADTSPVRPRILVVASSNLAVDEVMSRIAGQLDDVQSVRRGRVVRYGRQLTSALTDPHRDQIAYDQVVARIRRQRMQRAVQLAVRLESRRDELLDVEFLLHNLPVHYEEERARLRRRSERLVWYVKRFESVVCEHALQFDHAFKHVDALGREVLDSCQVLGTTVHQALRSRRIRDARWDCVVLEEGSQLPAALGYALAIRARETVWLAGDFRQLEPVTVADTPLARHWLQRDLFSTSRSYSEALNGNVATAPFVSRLEVQHRMHPEICAAVNAAYGGTLRTDPAVEQARLNSCLVLPFPQSTGRAQRGIYLVDTTELRPWARALAGGSRENPMHLAVVRALLEVFDAQGLMPAVGSAPGRLAIISPFQAQARRISAIVDGRYAGRGIQSDTVHAFQGQGVDLLIVDLTESRGVPLSEWMHAREWSDSGARLLTVALSRCKERCLVIADCGSLYAQLQSLVPRPRVYRLLRHLEQYGGAIDVRRHIITPVQALRQARRLADKEAVAEG